MASYYGLRRTTRVLAVFLCGTILATIYLGWHFAVDDVAGLAIALGERAARAVHRRSHHQGRGVGAERNRAHHLK